MCAQNAVVRLITLRNIVVFIAIVLSISVSKSQSNIGLLFGGTQYRGDLSDDNVGIYANLKPAFGIIYHYKWNGKYSFYSSFTSSSMQSYDKDLTDPALIQRNLHFRSPLREISMGIEIHPISFFTDKEYWISPYYKTGVSMFYFNPQAEYEGKWYNLKPLRTEGQGLPNSDAKQYSLFDVAYPFGLGVKIKVSSRLNIRFEIVPRKSQTDYLDDVSREYYDLGEIKRFSSEIAAKLAYRATEWDIISPPDVMGKKRGNFALNDWYVIHQFSLSYTFERPAAEDKSITPIETLPEIK